MTSMRFGELCDLIGVLVPDHELTQAELLRMWLAAHLYGGLVFAKLRKDASA